MRDAHQAALNCITADWSYKGDRFIGKYKGKVMQFSDLATNVVNRDEVSRWNYLTESHFSKITTAVNGTNQNM